MYQFIFGLCKSKCYSILLMINVVMLKKYFYKLFVIDMLINII